MNVIILLFMFSSALVDLVKLSLMPRRIYMFWCLFWGIIAVFVTLVLSEMTRVQLIGGINLSSCIALEWIELGIFINYIIKSSKFKKVWNYYPGFMIWIPITAISSNIFTQFPGKDFYTIATVVGFGIFFLLSVTCFVFNIFKANKNTLYYVAVCCGLINIITLGTI